MSSRDRAQSCVSPKEFNLLGTTLCVPIMQGRVFAPYAGFAATLSGAGTKTGGVVLSNQVRVLDLAARKGEIRRESPGAGQGSQALHSHLTIAAPLAPRRDRQQRAPRRYWPGDATLTKVPLQLRVAPPSLVVALVQTCVPVSVPPLVLSVPV
jgi:mRNA-degrading endonuclease toxin of MazEF toxin-antitoxin module